MRVKAILVPLICAGFLAACAPAPRETAIRSATVTDVQQSIRKEFVPSGGGALLGLAAGGALGNKIGGGNGRKAAAVLGALAGASVGGAMGGEERLVRYSVVTIRDPQSGELLRVPVEGDWKRGMLLRYSVTEDGKFIQR